MGPHVANVNGSGAGRRREDMVAVLLPTAGMGGDRERPAAGGSCRAKLPKSLMDHGLGFQQSIRAHGA
jgi:hypothetical protein